MEPSLPIAHTRDILAEIAAYKREFVLQRKRNRSLVDMRRAADDSAQPEDFCAAVSGEGLALIAEIKKASPSKGLIRADFDPERIAAEYAQNGAAALSVLTDEVYFEGCDRYLQQARHIAQLPVLRKDFTVDAYQIYEARVLGADAILLIVALMDGGQLRDFAGLAGELGLAALVEVHTKEELDRALEQPPALVGINNRDLTTFETTLETTFELLDHVPDGVATVSESGINSREDIMRLEAAGLDAVLVGEALMRERHIGAKIRELFPDW
jgi:indole-3-glycerol phosphate synthase